MTDETAMPFGKHKGIPMSEVPDSYLAWLWDEAGYHNASDVSKRDLHLYIKSSLPVIGEKYVIKNKPQP